MTISEVASEQKISPTRLMQLIEELDLVKDVDYTSKEICFTDAGVEKIRNRNKNKGRPVKNKYK